MRQEYTLFNNTYFWNEADSGRLQTLAHIHSHLDTHTPLHLVTIKASVFGHLTRFSVVRCSGWGDKDQRENQKRVWCVYDALAAAASGSSGSQDDDDNDDEDPVVCRLLSHHRSGALAFLLFAISCAHDARVGEKDASYHQQASTLAHTQFICCRSPGCKQQTVVLSFFLFLFVIQQQCNKYAAHCINICI